MFKLFLMSFLVRVTSMTVKMSHPLSLTLSLMLACFFIGSLSLKVSSSWLFYLLVLMFLGGVMVVITYMASLAANEKSFYSGPTNFIFWALLVCLVCPFLDLGWGMKLSSSFNFAGGAYALGFLPALTASFMLLFLALVSVVKLMKLEEGPLVKRL